MTITITNVAEFKGNVKTMTKQGTDRVAAAKAKEDAYSPLTKALKGIWHTYRFGDMWKPTGALFTALCADAGDEGVEFECGESKTKHNYKPLSCIVPLKNDGTEDDAIIVIEKCVNDEGNCTKAMNAKGKLVGGIATTAKWRYATEAETTALLAAIPEDKLEDYLDKTNR